MKASSSCGNNNANNASNSLASVCEENSSDESIDINRDPFATKKINFNQMSEADDGPGVASENNVTVLQCTATDFVARDSAENMIKCATQSLGISNNESVMGATRRKMSLKVIAQKELHDVDELKRAKRRQSNRESARRSRMRKQAELQKLREAVEVLKAESASLKGELLSRSSEYLKLKDENESIMEELKLRYREDEIPYLEAFMARYLMNSESYRREENSVLSQSRTSSPSSLNVGAS